MKQILFLHLQVFRSTPFAGTLLWLRCHGGQKLRCFWNSYRLEFSKMSSLICSVLVLFTWLFLSETSCSLAVFSKCAITVAPPGAAAASQQQHCQSPGYGSGMVWHPGRSWGSHSPEPAGWALALGVSVCFGLMSQQIVQPLKLQLRRKPCLGWETKMVKPLWMQVPQSDLKIWRSFSYFLWKKMVGVADLQGWNSRPRPKTQVWQLVTGAEHGNVRTCCCAGLAWRWMWLVSAAAKVPKGDPEVNYLGARWVAYGRLSWRNVVRVVLSTRNMLQTIQ